MGTDEFEQLIRSRVERIRSFERLYVHHLRKLQQGLAGEDFTLSDVTVIHELASGAGSGSWLADRLGLDTGYVSRILGKLREYGLVEPRDSPTDRRMVDWYLTAQGSDYARRIEDVYRDRARVVLFRLMEEEQRRLVAAMRIIEDTLRNLVLRF